MKSVICMHVQSVYRQVVCSQVERLEHFAECQKLSVTKDNNLVIVVAELILDEAQQVFLVHAGTVVHVRVDLLNCSVQYEAREKNK